MPAEPVCPPADRRKLTPLKTMRPLSTVEKGPIVVAGAIRQVENIEQDFDTGQRVAEIDIEARDPLGGLIGEQECRDERQELARRLVEHDNRVPAADQDAADHNAAERFHHRRRPVHDSRKLVAGAFDVHRVFADTPAHFLFEVESLHDPQTLNRFLQGLGDACAARKFGLGDASHALCEMTHDEDGRPHQQERDQREQRRLKHHDREQARQRHDIAAERCNQDSQHVAGCTAAVGNPGDELGRMPVREI